MTDAAVLALIPEGGKEWRFLGNGFLGKVGLAVPGRGWENGLRFVPNSELIVFWGLWVFSRELDFRAGGDG